MEGVEGEVVVPFIQRLHFFGRIMNDERHVIYLQCDCCAVGHYEDYEAEEVGNFALLPTEQLRHVAEITGNSDLHTRTHSQNSGLHLEKKFLLLANTLLVLSNFIKYHSHIP